LQEENLQIALSGETRDKADMSAIIKTGYRATIIYPINTSVMPRATFASNLLTHNKDAQVCNVVTSTKTPAAALLSKQKIPKDFPVPGTIGNVVSTNRNDDMLPYGTVGCH
jgi:hypothetical protein